MKSKKAESDTEELELPAEVQTKIAELETRVTELSTTLENERRMRSDPGPGQRKIDVKAVVTRLNAAYVLAPVARMDLEAALLLLGESPPPAAQAQPPATPGNLVKQ